MKTFITALCICSFSSMSVTVTDQQTVDVQPGQDITLQCSNMSSVQGQTFWFRLAKGTKAHCISVMNGVKNPAYCDGFENDNFEMTSNLSTVSLKIKKVNLSDSGLYFCGFYISGRPSFCEVNLNVKESEPHDDADSKCNEQSDGKAKITNVVLGVLTVVMVMVIIGLVVKNRKLQTVHEEDQKPEKTENESFEELSYAAVTFRSKAKPEKRREKGSDVIYAATR